MHKVTLLDLRLGLVTLPAEEQGRLREQVVPILAAAAERLYRAEQRRADQ